MSYNVWATREGVTYKGLVGEAVGKDGNTFCISLWEASDGGPCPPYPLITDLGIVPVRTGMTITVTRQGEEFWFRTEELVGDANQAT